MMAISSGAAASDTIRVDSVKKEKELSWLRRTIRGFSYIDENYVEPQHYNWSVMALGRYTYDNYRLATVGDNGQSVSFSPRTGIKFGPYFGWRWVFLGYTIDLSNISFDFSSSRWQGIDASLYSAQIGADVFYHHTRNNYKIREVRLGDKVNVRALEDIPFDGFNVGTTGFNVYYIFNHQRFSYPAAFAQSTMQKISCGSWMAGFGYLRNSLDFDYDKMQALVNDKLGREVPLDSGLMFNSVKYTDISLSGGYAYNWVFAPDFLFCSSLSLALGYKKSRGETADEGKEGFDIGNFNLDGIGRFGLVYNNMRWYAGASVIVRAYNYHKSRFATNNVFGSMNIYVGYNFGARGKYKKKKN